MQLADLSAEHASRTIPQGIPVLDRGDLPYPMSGTPRYGWDPSTGHDPRNNEYLLFVEASLAEDDEEEGVLSGFASNEALSFGIVPIDSPENWHTGTGYRSPYRTVLDSYLWIRTCRLSERQTGMSLPIYPQEELLPSTCAKNFGIYLSKEILLERFEDLLQSKLQNMVVSMLTRSSAELLRSTTGTSEDATQRDDAIKHQIHEQATHIGAIRWLEEHAGLSQGAIADLVGVSRQTVQDWLKGEGIRDQNRQRLLAVQEILKRVQRRHPHEDALKTWLDTPHSPDAKTPRQLLEENEIGRARALSLSEAPLEVSASPAWLRESPPDAWTVRQRRRRERGVRDELITKTEDDPDPDWD